MPIILFAYGEILESFVIIGIFLIVSKLLFLKKEKKILLLGTIWTFILIGFPAFTFFLRNNVKITFIESSVTPIEVYVIIFSWISFGYIVTSLYRLFKIAKRATVKKNYDKFSYTEFDLLLSLTLIVFVIREGFEYALFTSKILI